MVFSPSSFDERENTALLLAFRSLSQDNLQRAVETMPKYYLNTKNE